MGRINHKPLINGKRHEFKRKLNDKVEDFVRKSQKTITTRMNKVEKKINDVGESENSLLSSVSLTLKTITKSSPIRNGPNPLSYCMSSPTKRREHRQPFKTPYRAHQEPKVQYVRSTTQRSRFTAKKFTKSYRSDPLPRLKLRPYNHPWDSPLSKRDKSIQLNPYCSERARPITFDIKPPKFTRMPYGKATKFL